jgi:DNA-binding CsgD family transcriptional regulator
MTRTRKLSDAKDRVILRRSQIAESYSKGHNIYQISDILHIPKSTVSKDLRIMRRLAVTNVDSFIKERLPFEIDSMLTGSTQLLRKAFAVIENPQVTEKSLWAATDKILSIYAFRRELMQDKLTLAVNGEVKYISDLDLLHQPGLRREGLPEAIISGHPSAEQSQSEAVF